MRNSILSLIVIASLDSPALAQTRARDLGVPFEGSPGELNAITDVSGVEVGHTTLVAGEDVRTGVTVVLPEGRGGKNQVFAGWFTLNADGEMTGTTWIEESGILEGPVAITNTHSVGTVHQAVIEWSVAHVEGVTWSLPVVAETWDGGLNDINGFHVKREHVFAAIEGARSGPVSEGNVGGGTGMRAYEFKGGIGTASRIVSSAHGPFTVGVLVQANYGLRSQLRIAGAPVGREITDLMPEANAGSSGNEDGSIIVVIATDAPVLPHQLKRIAKRAGLGLGRNGSIASNGSGDIFIAFSTAHKDVGTEQGGLHEVEMLGNSELSPLFAATVEATEEAIVNAMVAAETMTGVGGNKVYAIPHERLREILRKYNRLLE
ncbi:MAG TPA: P1 family peptidase [Vicinamibacteria bacterium]|nr:P1 family peptidase [Vicinamibacteria bacterium]